VNDWYDLTIIFIVYYATMTAQNIHIYTDKYTHTENHAEQKS